MTLWSQVARSEFRALFQDSDYSEQFQRDVARALVAGWSHNKDKPLWAWLRLQWALTTAPHAPFASEGPLAVMRPGAEIWAGLRALALNPDSQVCQLSQQDKGAAGLVLLVGGQAQHLSRYRCEQLVKIAEFILARDGYAAMPDTLALLGKAQALAVDDAAGFNDLVRHLSREWYTYRAKHFHEGAAADTLRLVTLSAEGQKDIQAPDLDPDQDPVMRLWQHPQNQRLASYKACFTACLHAYTLQQTAQSMASLDRAQAEESHVLEAARAAFSDQMTGDEGYAQASAMLDTHTESTALDVFQNAVQDTPLKLFTKTDLECISSLLTCQDSFEVLWVSWFRLMALHPIQAGISNDLRFAGQASEADKRSRLQQRLAGDDARSYEDIYQQLDGLEAKLRKWLMIAYGLRCQAACTDEGGDAPLDTMAQEGLKILSKERVKSLQRDQAELAQSFAALEPALITAQQALSRFVGFAQAKRESLCACFADDKAAYLAVLERQYSA